MAIVRERVGPEDCVGIRMMTAGMWIPVLSFRCTVPFHGLSVSTINKEFKGTTARRKWQYVSALETKRAVQGHLETQGPAQLWRLR